jgi:DNA-binding response OmpR family regulator
MIVSIDGKTEKSNTILFADDDPTMLKVMEMNLKGEGYSVVTASDGQNAQNLLRESPDQFSAVLLDWQMPNLSGIDLLKWMKSHQAYETIPVIMVTAMVTREHIREGINAGAFYYVTKPFDNQILLSIISAAVRDYQYKQSLLERLRQSHTPFLNLLEGTFRFRTIEEGEQLVLWLANMCPAPHRATHLSELIVNAVEHGNLGITYDEKTRLFLTGGWSQEIQRRLQLPENRNKFVQMAIERRRGEFTILVEDRGPGFDFEKYLQFDEQRVFHNHGRGIAMACAALDVQFLDKGNKVLVTIPFEKSV